MKNYDLNMDYFNSLDKDDFDAEINGFIKRHNGFHEVADISGYEGVPGYYMMVLDGYKQAYIGKSDNIKKRIRQHWTKTKHFDRTLFPMYAADTSCFSIDFFRVLDTTRIFLWQRDLEDGVERELVKDFPRKYCTNRIGGDVTTGIEALATLNKRNL